MMRKVSCILFLTFATLYLIGCAGGAGSAGGAASSVSNLPFGLGLEDTAAATTSERYAGVKLDVIVPVFDPGIPEDPDEYEKLGVWPELRRTESVRFADSLKQELQETTTFGDVRVVPDVAVAGDLYAIGKIIKSNGEDIEISLAVYDSSGKKWMKKSYKHRVKEYHWQDIRQKGKDPYQPVFAKVAKDIVKLLKKLSQKRLAELRTITEIKFASVFAQGAFAEHVKVENKRISLVSLPAINDPMLARTQAIRTVDGLFMDKMQTHYTEFVRDTNSSYVAWQEHSLTSSKELRKAKSKATVQAIAGGLLLLGAAYAGSQNDSNDPNVTAGAMGLAAGGVIMLQQSFTTKAEGKYHRDNLMELGQSLNFEVAPQVVEFEDTTLELRGGVKSQYRQWRDVLGELYERERTPDVVL